MARASIFTRMAATILEIGSREKCKVKVSCLTVREIFSIRVNGGMTIFKARENFITYRPDRTGPSTKGSSGLEIRMDLVSWSLETAQDTKVSSEITYFGVKAECLPRMGDCSKLVYGKKALLFHRCDFQRGKHEQMITHIFLICLLYWTLSIRISMMIDIWGMKNKTCLAIEYDKVKYVLFIGFKCYSLVEVCLFLRRRFFQQRLWRWTCRIILCRRGFFLRQLIFWNDNPRAVCTFGRFWDDVTRSTNDDEIRLKWCDTQK